VFDNDISQGSVEMIMKDLCDQQKYEGWFSLIDDKEQPTQTQIRLRIQFIWSRYVYFQGKCEKAVESLKKLNEEIIEINKYLEMFNKPYGLILYAEILEVLNKKVFEDQDDIVYSMPKISRNISKIISQSHPQNKNNQKFFSKLMINQIN
jgi:septum formation topological specificity factor MinE